MSEVEKTEKDKEENLVKKTCRELGITQKELAERIGVTTTSMSKWNNGSKIPIYVEKAISQILEYENLKIEYEAFRKNILRKTI